MVEAIRLIILGVRKRKEGSWIIAAGFATLWLFSSYDMLMDFGVIGAVGGIQNGYPFGFIGLIIAMSAYLARDLARTNEKLREYGETLEEKVHERTRELREAQDQLILKEKMASLENLVAGVAHEVNNPIGAVHSAADVTRRCIEKLRGLVDTRPANEDSASSHQLRNTLQILEDNNRVTTTASERITKIVRSLKSFAHLDEADFQMADIHEGLESTLTLLDHEIRDRISVTRDYGDLPKIECYPDQLNQAFMNVLTNAVQATSAEGQITIRTGLENGTGKVQISDTGAGIPSGDLGKVFAPGFTTRGVGVGTGLGLSISYNIVQKHNGRIDVESEVGVGTAITIPLPTDLKAPQSRQRVDEVRR